MNNAFMLFSFQLMPIAIFFSSFISILYYLGVMQAIVSVIGKFLGFCLGTTPAESISTAGNIFVGMVSYLDLFISVMLCLIRRILYVCL